MNKDEVNEYRRVVESEYSKKDNEIETTTSYLSAGLLGFFITVNERFISLNESTCKILFVLGMLLLSASFISILVRKYCDQRADIRLLDHISEMRGDGDLEMENKLYQIWKTGSNRSELILRYSFIFLALGVVTSVAFVLINLN